MQTVKLSPTKSSSSYLRCQLTEVDLCNGHKTVAVANIICLYCTVSLTFADNSQAARKNSSAILPVEPLKAFISKIKVLFFVVIQLL